MLPRGDGAGQHLCEGDLGYKTKDKNQQKMIPSRVGNKHEDKETHKQIIYSRVGNKTKDTN